MDAAVVAEATRHDSGWVATLDRGFDGIDGVTAVGCADWRATRHPSTLACFVE